MKEFICTTISSIIGIELFQKSPKYLNKTSFLNTSEALSYGWETQN